MPSNLSVLIAAMLWPCLAMGQEVQVSPGKSGVVLTIQAQKPYQLMSGEEKRPALIVECALKGKKTLHLVKFAPGGALAEDNFDVNAKGDELTFSMTIGGNKQTTTWIPYGDTVSYAYYGKTEPERVKFLGALLGVGTVSIEFKPFLTGAPTTSVFDVSELRQEMDKNPECAVK